ncbi:ABC transporter permease subunit [Paenibacillus donghaensis]|uniref:ABC transporter permease subunit n=1 Tax=Paenibacillus donghaensis TaxID=414771 RepID=UPI0018840090|nr:ABC transporter permease subunit [Paenibacillus donghaensis]MBE9917380.1 ABC transporter permease subunit [Paenibacillus donghaensis]
MDSAVFRNLVRHEFKSKGSWRRQSRSHITKGWWRAYFLLILISLVGTATYFAINNSLQLNTIWFVTMGFPYMVFFLGLNAVKREWENDTYGWWLTMPYPRKQLIFAKWLAVWLKIWAGILIVFVIMSAYVLILSLTIPYYSLDSVVSFMIAGINWLSLVAGFSPLIIALGILTSTIQNSVLRPISPVLWIVFMSGFSLVYQSTDRIFPEYMVEYGTTQFAYTWFPFPWELPVIMGLSWILTYVVLRFSAHLLEKKLDL